mmetsp:Transcript_15919/g.34458  ORF Transcript_15919/g.34458 Transcript_15919/m.34458 type:complete len:149 (+) Transcript_15919:138-584(+)
MKQRSPLSGGRNLALIMRVPVLAMFLVGSQLAEAVFLRHQANTQLLGSPQSQVGIGSSKPKGWDQCLHFARYVKEKEVSGIEMIKTWQATCQPAVRSGRATERYRLMCNSMAGAVEPFASQVDYNIEQLCDTVLALFHDLTAADAAGR